MRNVGALILAAGGSKRFGEPKQFLRFEGETLLRRIAKAAHDAGCAPIVVVAGDFSDRVSAELHDLPVQVVQNAEWRGGLGTSIKCGLAHLRNAVPAIVILACDQPLVSAEIIRIGVVFFTLWGCSSVGRAREWHSRGRGSDPLQLHYQVGRKASGVLPAVIPPQEQHTPLSHG